MKRDIILKTAAALFWLILWQIAAMALDNSIILVTPIEAVKRLFELLTEKEFHKTVLNSFLRISGGFAGAAAVSAALAWCSYKSKAARLFISPIVSVMGTIPVASFIIFALFWIKSSYLSTLISFVIVLPVVYSAVLKGLESTDRELMEAAEVFGFSLCRKLRYLYFPAVMPYLLAACKTGAGLAFKSGTAAEVIGQPDFTLGDMLFRAKLYLETADLFAWSAVIIVLGKLLEVIVCKGLELIYKKSKSVRFYEK